MKFLLSLTAVFVFATSVNSQRLHLNLTAGLMNYQGDLQSKVFTFEQSRFGFGAGLSYDVTPKFAIRAQGVFGTVSGDDKRGKNAVRNLNFISSISEFQIAGEYYILDLDERRISPYIFGGAAIFSFNPYTFDTSGTKHFLQPLSTEGQGFYMDRQPYKTTQFSIPFGGGIKLAFTENIRLGIEFGFRKTFTDYLDDVSSSYVDQNLLLANRGPKAVELAYRAGEIKAGQPYPADGEKRGEVNKNDWYYFTGITASFRLGNNLFGSGGGKGVGCPVLR